MDFKAHATFCDDVRFEIGGKASLIGCYDGIMFCHGPFPFTLQKLCVVLTYEEKLGAPTAPVAFEIWAPTDNAREPLAAGSLQADEFRNAPAKPVGEDLGLPPPEFLYVVAHFILSPLVLKTPGIIRAMITRGAVTFEAGRLRVLPATTKPNEDTQVTSSE
jgi:hypothetical protein